MRQFVLMLEKELANGIRQSGEAQLNKATMEDAVGTVLNEAGLAVPSYEVLEVPNVQYDYPFPQGFVTATQDLIFTHSRVYDFNDGVASDLNIDNVVPDGIWSFTQYGESWFAANGSCLLTNAIGQATAYPRAISAIIEHDGRILMGGFGNPFTNAFINWIYNKARSRVDRLEDFVYWTMVGADDLEWLLTPTLPSDDVLSAMLARNDFGFAPLIGRVTSMHVLGSNVLVGTTKGLYVMTSVVDPFPSYGIKRVINNGIIAIGGSSSIAYVVTDKGYVIVLSDNGFKVVNLSTYIDTKSIVVVTYNELTDHAYVCDGKYTYVFYGTKFTRLRELITGVINGKVIEIKSKGRS